MPPAISTQNLGGIDFYAAYDAISASTPEIPAHPFSYGTQVDATDGSIWVFCKVNGGIVQYDAVFIDTTYALAVPAIGGAAALGVNKKIGWYQGATALTAGMAAWFMIHGAPRIRVNASVAANTQLYTTNTSGLLDTAVVTGSQYPIRNVVAVAANGGTISNVQGSATFPSVGPMTAVS